LHDNEAIAFDLRKDLYIYASEESSIQKPCQDIEGVREH